MGNQMRNFLIGLFTILISAILAGVISLILIIGYIQWPKTETERWNSLPITGLPQTEITQIRKDPQSLHLFVRTENDTRYVYVSENSQWEETSENLKFHISDILCPRTRPSGKVVAEHCFASGMGYEIYVALQDGTLWRYNLLWGDNYIPFRYFFTMMAIIAATILGAVVGIVIVIVKFRQRKHTAKG